MRVPEEHYRQARGFPPDLMVYFDELRLRAIGSIGSGRIVVTENDTGLDSCNHDWDGIFVMSGGPTEAQGRVEGAEIYDVAPTILGAFGLPRPPGILGKGLGPLGMPAWPRQCRRGWGALGSFAWRRVRWSSGSMVSTSS